MNILQRALLILVAVIILLGGVITIFSPTIAFWEYLAFLISISIPTALFYFAFSIPKEKKSEENKYQSQSKPQTYPQNVPQPGDRRKPLSGEINLSTVGQQEEVKKLDALVQSTGEDLYKITTVFPFDFFPTDIIINQKQILLIDRYFFWASRDFPIPIKNITMPIVEVGPFFATISIEVTGFDQNPGPIRYFRKAEAYRAKRIIFGLVTCDKEGIDLSNMNKEEILAKVEEIGRTRFS